MLSDVRRCDVPAVGALAGPFLLDDDLGGSSALQEALGAQVLHEASDALPAGGVDLLGQLVDDGGQGARPVELIDDEGGGASEAVVGARHGVEQHRLIIHPDDQLDPSAQPRNVIARHPRRTRRRGHRVRAPSGRIEVA